MASPLASYPEIFIEIASKAYYGEKVDPLPMMDERNSYPQLHRFNRFRNQLVKEKNPFAFAAKDLIVRRECLNGQWCLTFSPSGLYEAKVFAAGAEAELKIREQIRTLQPEVDKGEEMFARMAASHREKQQPLQEVEEPVVPIEGCVHEFKLGRCLKCGLPGAA